MAGQIRASKDAGAPLIIYDPRMVNDVVVGQFYRKQVDALAKRALAILPPAQPAPITTPPHTADTFELKMDIGGLGGAIAGVLGNPLSTTMLPEITSFLSGIPTALFSNTSSFSGAAGPLTDDSFIESRIVRKLPNAFFYPSVLPLEIKDPSTKLYEAIDSFDEVQQVLTAADDPARIKPQLAADLTSLKSKIIDGMFASDVNKRRGFFESARKSLSDARELASNLAVSNAHNEGLRVFRRWLDRFEMSLESDPITRLYGLKQAVDKQYYQVQASLETQLAVFPLTSSLGDPTMNPEKTRLSIVNTDIPAVESALTGQSPGTAMTTALASALQTLQSDVSTLLNSPATPTQKQQVTTWLNQANSIQSGAITGLKADVDGEVAALSSPANNGTDNLAIVVLRDWACRNLICQGAKTLRLVLEASEGTDRIDQFSFRIPAHRSSGTAVLSYMIIDSAGKVDKAGTTLAYAPFTLSEFTATNDASGTIQVLRDEPAAPGYIQYEEPVYEVTSGEGGSIVVSRGYNQHATFTCSIYDPVLKKVDKTISLRSTTTSLGLATGTYTLTLQEKMGRTLLSEQEVQLVIP